VNAVITDTPEWQTLAAHHAQLRATHLRDLFAADPGRGDRMVVEVDGLTLDYSKHRVTDETIRLLAAVAERAGLRDRIDAMFRGDHINVTEDRPALHAALRMPQGTSLVVDGGDVIGQVQDELARMAHFAELIRSRQWLGYTGIPITNIVNIGIGGSDLGPAMATLALHAYADPGITAHFVSNIDGAQVWAALDGLDPAATLFVVSSKTFTTLETLTNARTARQWLVEALGSDAAVPHHFVAVSTNAVGVSDFGIDPRNTFGFWDWVGGRYSVDSAIGLSLMVTIGPAHFAEFLAGFRSIDRHVEIAPYFESIPVLMGLLGVWYRNLFGLQTHAVLPYAHELARFPAYLQQLEMESNGKHVALDGSPVALDTAPIVWGEPGTNGQHAFYQLLHQGTTVVPADLIGFARANHLVGAHQDLLAANVIAQAEALAFGRTEAQLRDLGAPAAQIPHRVCEGNRPTSLITAERVSPFTLGQLIACYEHKVLTQGVIWNVDSFDQWGVELGKQLAQAIIPELQSVVEPPLAHDSSTNRLIRWYRSAGGN